MLWYRLERNPIPAKAEPQRCKLWLWCSPCWKFLRGSMAELQQRLSCFHEDSGNELLLSCHLQTTFAGVQLDPQRTPWGLLVPRSKGSSGFSTLSARFYTTEILYYFITTNTKERKGDWTMTLTAWCFGGHQFSNLSGFHKEARDWETSSYSSRSSGLKMYLNFQIKAKGYFWQLNTPKQIQKVFEKINLF